MDPFLSLESDDLMAAGALLAPAAAFYSFGATTTAIVAGIIGVLSAVPLLLWPPVAGRRGYARALAWATWLFEPRRCDPPTVDRDQDLPPIFAEEVFADGRRGRRQILPDPPTETR